ncbi:MAG: cob(I)yrinic acid a,c-diamide adenosyltransferase [Bacteroidota bacterium]
MKIYTRTGDGGQTSLFGGKRISKDSLRLEAYGSVDELNSHLGAIRSLKPSQQIDALLERIQNDLFILGADLATPLTKKSGNVQRIGQAHIDALERNIDTFEAGLKPLTAFILPGGTAVGSQLHIARTVCRRVERFVVKLSKKEHIGKLPTIYLNRLSDLLFVTARYANKRDAAAETTWSPHATP